MKKNPPLNPTQGSSAFLQSSKTREYLLSCNCCPYVFCMLHLKPPQGQEALGSGFSIALWGPRNCKNGPLMSVKDHELSNILELFILLNTLADFQHISSTTSGCVAHFFHYFSPWKKRLTAFAGEEATASLR